MNASDDTMIGGKRQEICALMTVQRARFPGARPLGAPIRAASLVPPADERQPDRNRPALARKRVPYGESRLKLHQPLDDVAEQLPDNFILSPLFNELSECDTGFGHRGVPFAKDCRAKTTFAKSHDGRPLSYEAGRLIHHALGHDRAESEAQ
jgi:hypothetical protein